MMTSSQTKSQSQNSGTESNSVFWRSKSCTIIDIFPADTHQACYLLSQFPYRVSSTLLTHRLRYAYRKKVARIHLLPSVQNKIKPGMAVSKSESDVILNRANVALARSQRLVASWLPAQTEDELANTKSEEELQREEDEIFTAVPET